MSQPCFYVTTPIYYVNDRPHIGHAYTTILADVLARYHRMLETPTFFLTGTDEHGQKVAKAAAAAGMTPQEQADTTVVRFQELWQKLDITNDDFIRTTEPRHKRVVQQILQTLFDRGEIYRDEYDGWYCTPCERFFTEKDLAEDKCPECGRDVEKIREANYFFRMSAYQQWLIQYIEEHPEFIQPSFRRNETLGFLRKPLNDLCISRPKRRMSWGIELPFDADYVTYVWFDALVNYISAVGYLADEARFHSWWPASLHLIGKDILTTHTVYWPTMLRAMGLPMPRTIFAHGWWLLGDSKMSKSSGNVVNPMDLIQHYGVDAFRYFVMAEMSLGQDAAFSEDAFIRRFNSDLANDLGNLLSRVLKMTETYCGGVIPPVPSASLMGDEERAVWQLAEACVTGLEQAVEQMKLDTGIGGVLTAIRAVNRYLEQKKPWFQAKSGDQVGVGVTLYTALECLRVTAGVLEPVMPGKMTVLRASLGLSNRPPRSHELRQWGLLSPGTPLVSPGVLFPRIEPPAQADAPAPEKKPAKVQKTKGAPAPKQEAAAPQAEGVISYADFTRTKLRAARILSAERIEGADKLLRLQVDLGAEQRQLVAGIALYYKPEDIVGKTVAMVANLAPARIRGVESNGMILAAGTPNGLRLVLLDDDVPPGSEIK